MSENEGASASEQNIHGQQVTVRPVREVRVVQDVVPMWDTAAFEHLARVASVMADAELLPRTITHVKDGNNEVALPIHTVKARALLIANQARIWDMDPLAVAQCASLVHNRLMFEGKLVHAVIEAKTGIALQYEFGTWNALTESVDLSKEGEGDFLGVVVTGITEDGVVLTIEGGVGSWKTAGNNSPWHPGAFKRQLRYRGAREWARAHKPGPILGVITDDEYETLEDRRGPRAPQTSGLAARLAAAGPVEEIQTGFSVAHVQSEAGKAEPSPTDDPAPAKRRGRPPKAAQVPAEAQEPAAAETVAKEANKPSEPIEETKAAEIVEEDDVPMHLRRLAGGMPEEVTQDARGNPIEEEADDDDGEVVEQEADDEGAAEAEDPAPVEEKPEEDGGDDVPAALQAFVDAVDNEPPSFAAINAAIATFFVTDDFKGLTDAQQNGIRAKTWASVKQMSDRTGEIVDQADNLAAFRLWLEYTSDIEAIQGTLPVLQRSEAWKKATDNSRNNIQLAVKRRIIRIEEAG